MRKTFKLEIPEAALFSFIVLAGLLVITWLGYSIVKEMGRKQQVVQSLDSFKAAIEEIEKENLELLQKKKYFESEENIEREARRRLNLKRPDEHVAIIVTEENKDTQEADASQGEETEESNFFIRLWNFLF